MKSTAPTSKRRRIQLIQLIHVAKRDLQLDDQTYQAILQQYGTSSSSADLSIPTLEKVLEHMKRAGFKVRSKTKSKPEKSRALAQDGESRKIRALWLFMHDLGIVRDASEKALASYVRRLTRVEALQWLSDEQTLLVIESLKKWAMRFLPQIVRERAQAVLALPLSDADRMCIIGLFNSAQGRGFDVLHGVYESCNELTVKYRRATDAT